MNDNRIFGLDLLRSIAIILVVITHSSFFTEFFNCSVSLPDGVDLFFVLSGYLVGTILIKIINEQQRFDFAVVLKFLKRRWVRTLPNYFLFLFLNIILIYFGLIKGTINKYLITYFFFFQNFHKPYDFLFWESWSLSVEEWFYLMLPLIMLVLFKLTKMKAKQIIFSIIIAFLIFPLVYRISQSGQHLDFDLFFRKLVVTRLDAIGYGLLAAFIHYYYSGFWNRTKNIFFFVGLVMIVFLPMINIQSLFIKETVYFSLTGISVFFILPKLESWRNESIPYKPFQFISKISYSMYLLHIPLLQIFSRVTFVSDKLQAILLYGFFWIVTLVLSYFVYRFFEKPIMNLRGN